ncbi:MAG: molybdopterin molybdotransferase MoeA [Lachnospiraceae bacterium]|nr:molybdopterin molybdotransferase MoeA [Lachnospiraceae bacterium]
MVEKITLEEAVSLICGEAHKCEKVEEIAVERAGGYILAEDIYAGIDNPPFPRTPVDGYAVRAEDLKGASEASPVRLKVVGCIYAGCDGQSCSIQPGEAMRIMTGGPFPKGSNCAVRQEDTDYGEDTVAIYKEHKEYDNYCFQGEDYTKDSLLLKKGDAITFAEQGILSAVGRTIVKVFKKPVVRILTTGDEVCAPGQPLLQGKIYDSNGMMVSSRLRELGIEPAEISHVADSEEVLAEKLQQACKDADIVITTGGVSVGKKDILHGALEKLGADKIFWRVLIQPGTPSIFSVYENTLIISLSGNPFGAMANLELLVRPLLYEMTGNQRFAMEKREGILMEVFPKKSKGRRFVRAIYKNGEVTLPSGILSSGAIGTLRGCNCLLEIPAGSPALDQGEKVTVWML